MKIFVGRVLFVVRIYSRFSPLLPSLML